MKRRIRKVANFFAFNLLFFALYLNFIHKDKTGVSGSDQAVQPRTEAFSGTQLVENTDQIQSKKEVSTVPVKEVVAVKPEKNDGTALRLSIN